MTRRAPKSFVTHPKNPIRAWSPSKESTFSECPSHAAFDVTHKAKQDDGPALVHGRKVHDELAALVMAPSGKAIFTPESSRYVGSTVLVTEIAAFREALAQNDAQAELEVAVNRDLAMVDWFAPDVWYRAKIDLLYRPAADKLVVSDWKTGKPNPKDKKQLEQYAWIGAMLAKVASVETRLVYLATNTVDAATYTLATIRRLGATWKRRGEEITDAKLRIVATPSESACRFCPHGKSRGGPCEFEYQRQTAVGLRHKWGGGSL